ncbi:Hypothetical protein IALB_1361 [Ignavibacterium album JCM 16511]|uniref:Uncharacterized protein n=1 Tax=Ignavibacterium album (strain DSM 19864 / JCM 16511 / NBRC 101810 / Mat9-16) TaxID=945713 RepID=I0AJB4_IGNAJ|nr:hypothetical protein [Ignavibacterium album]AFH49071.1 Hypothetical protein IALB_1361 [Ignavibacterium album JCM 16511]
MITGIIFAIHILFILVIFTKKWQDESLSTAFLNVGLIVILFSVGWTITGMIAKALMEPEGFGRELNRDTFSLVLLTIAEFFFYKFYYSEDFISADKEKQSQQSD